MKRQLDEQRIRQNMEKITKQKEFQAQEKARLLAEIAKEKGAKNGVQIAPEYLVQPEPKTIPEKFKEIYEKMSKIYPPKTAEGEKMKTCLQTVIIYLSKRLNSGLT